MDDEDDSERSLENPARVQIRTTVKVRKEWKDMANDIAPFPDQTQEDAIKRVLEVYEQNPQIFRRDYR